MKKFRRTEHYENNQRPRHPGEILKSDYLDPLGITQQDLADHLGITRVRINEVVLGKRAITHDTAIRLARFFDTTVEYWLGMQTDILIWEARKNNEEEYRKIVPFKNIGKKKPE